MKLVFHGIQQIFDFEDEEHVCSLVIENPEFLSSLLLDLNSQLKGEEGNAVLSQNDKPMLIDKNLELHSLFAPFTINQRGILNKVIAKMSEISVDPEHYQETSELISEIERYCLNLSFSLEGDFVFSKISPEAVIKASGVEIADDHTCLSEKLLDYFELVRTYDREKVFILLNLRSFMGVEETQRFIEEILQKRFQVLFLESSEWPMLEHEKRYLIDESLCEIC